MARSNVRSARRAPKRRAAKRPARKGKKASNAKQYATIQETLAFADIKANTPVALVFNLAQFSRASTLAPNFRWYKAAKVEWHIEALYNTYQDGIGGDTVPYLYRNMDRTQNSLSFSLDEIRSTGAKPVRMVGKKVFSFVPNWCSPGLATRTFSPAAGVLVGGTSQGLQAQFSYLATPDLLQETPGNGNEVFLVPIDTRLPPIPSNLEMTPTSTNVVTYNGMDLFIEQAVSAGNPIIAKLTATVTWLFKDPKYHSLVIAEPVVPKE